MVLNRIQKSLIERAKSLGLDVDVWRPNDRRVFRFTFNGVVLAYCRTSIEATAFVLGFAQGITAAPQIQTLRKCSCGAVLPVQNQSDVLNYRDKCDNCLDDFWKQEEK